jgi:serine/threonine protein phosphatase 1
MRTLVIGDIHGCLTALNSLLALVGPGPEDQFITLGDYVDRGPDSRGVLDRLIALFESGRLVPLRGNHDEMMLACRKDRGERRMWLTYGGVQTLESYGHQPGDDLYEGVPERHYSFLEKDCLDWYETPTHLFAHASIFADVPISGQDEYVLRWRRLDGPIEHYSGKVFICGHTRQPDGLPLDMKSTICIDTGAYQEDGWLTCLHLETGEYYQANERGETRRGSLEELARFEE